MKSEETARDSVAQRGTLTADRVLGVIGGTMVITALGLLFFGGPSDGGAEPVPPPSIELVLPADGETTDTPLQLHFRAGAPLSRGPGGWGAASYHLHAAVDGVEIMPGPDDIVAAGDGSHVWTVRGLRPGEKVVRLFWSDSEHAPVEGAGADPVTVLLVDSPETEPSPKDSVNEPESMGGVHSRHRP